MAILEVTNLKKGFGATDVLKGVSFSLEQGQVLAIIGSSGSGKTTLLRCLNFLEAADGGQIRVNGKLLTGENLSEDQIRENTVREIACWILAVVPGILLFLWRKKGMKLLQSIYPKKCWPRQRPKLLR